MQGWEAEATSRIFFRSGRLLSKRVKTLEASLLPILEIRGHSTTF